MINGYYGNDSPKMTERSLKDGNVALFTPTSSSSKVKDVSYNLNENSIANVNDASGSCSNFSSSADQTYNYSGYTLEGRQIGSIFSEVKGNVPESDMQAKTSKINNLHGLRSRASEQIVKLDSEHPSEQNSYSLSRSSLQVTSSRSERVQSYQRNLMPPGGEIINGTNIHYSKPHNLTPSYAAAPSIRNSDSRIREVDFGLNEKLKPWYTKPHRSTASSIYNDQYLKPHSKLFGSSRREYYGDEIPSLSSKQCYADEIPALSRQWQYGDQIPSLSGRPRYGDEIPSLSSHRFYVNDIPSPSGRRCPGDEVPSLSAQQLYGDEIPSLSSHWQRMFHEDVFRRSKWTSRVVSVSDRLGSSNSGHTYLKHRMPDKVVNSNDHYQTNKRNNLLRNNDTLSDQVRGPRANKERIASTSSAEKRVISPFICEEQYNKSDFVIEYEHAKFFMIKSYSEDDIHKSVKYNVWASTPHGNNKLDAAFHEAQNVTKEKGGKCPIFLFFSVNASGQFVGMAEMIGPVDFKKTMDFWQQDRWNGFFPLTWHVIKDIPNRHFLHITLENNDNRAVTFSRDTQEIGLPQGLKMLQIFKSFPLGTSILDDFNFYEEKENKRLSMASVSKNLKSSREVEYDNFDFIENLETEMHKLSFCGADE